MALKLRVLSSLKILNENFKSRKQTKKNVYMVSQETDSNTQE